MMLRKAVLLSSNAEGSTKLNAFDNALLNAGIGNANLVKLSSVIPENVEWLSEVPAFPIGTVLFAVYTHIESEKKGEKISAAVGVGIRSADSKSHTDEINAEITEQSERRNQSDQSSRRNQNESTKGSQGEVRNGGGLIYEFAGVCDAEHAVRKVKEMLSEGFAVREWKMAEMRVAVAEHLVREKPGCALAAVVFFP